MGNIMNIFNIDTRQGLQNAIHPASEDNSATSKRPVSIVTTVNRGTLSGKSEATLGQSLGITTSINNLQKDLESDPNIVLYPPFFPIATYQRLDLIEKIGGIEEEIQQSSLDESLKSAFSSNNLKVGATDTEISAAIDRLFALRDQLTGSGSASADKIKPGSILSIEV